MKIIFAGTPEFGEIILEKLIKYMPSFVLSPYMPSFALSLRGPFQPILVITAPDKPVGRKQILTPPPVKTLAEKYKISVLQPEKIKNYRFTIESHEPDLIVVAAYGQILPKEILKIPKHGCLNLHPSLLPRWRGASPIQYTILNGDQETGVTIILMDEKMDHGPVVANSKFEIKNPKITYKELEDTLANLGAKLLIETIPKWLSGKISPQPQDEKKATYTKILKREDGKIEWQKSAQAIERQIRAFGDWPGSFSFWPRNKKRLRLKILKADVSPQTGHGPFGIRGKTFQAPNNKIAVQTGKDFLIIEKLQLEGKKPQGSEEFLRGQPDFVGSILE
jgi:methionyl-tRNA formyltransferase